MLYLSAMIDFGSWMLTLGLFAAAGATALGLYGSLRTVHDTKAIASSYRLLHLSAFSSWAAGLVLLKLLLDRDYRVAYVWEYTSNALPDVYAASALWAGQSGSLLFWLMVLGVMSSIAIVRNAARQPALAPHATWVLASIQLFFFVLLAFVADPFELLSHKFPDSLGQHIPDGNGLNPMLQNFGMIIHPPLLYLGYVGFAIPFAFAMAALASNHLTPDWIRTTRVWTILSWAFLSLGIISGAKWAYVELGWGGYWAWDPVENASLMPWLTATAFLHSVMIEERRGMLRRWNIFLVILTFLLSIFGTFLTRSGVLQSVHSFAQSDVGDVFLWFMGGWAILGGVFFLGRWKALESRYAIDSLLSREAFFLFQNLVLLGICGAVMWGTMYPIVSEAITGDKVTVSAPYFNRVVLPLGLALFLLTGAGPMIAWRRASAESMKRNLGLPLLAGCVTAGISWAMGARDLLTLNAFALATFVVASILMDIYICARARQKSAQDSFARSVFLLMDRNRRRYGGFLVHFGMAVLLVGLAGNAFSRETEMRMAPGESLALGEYSILYKGFTETSDKHRVSLKADVDVLKNGKLIGAEDPSISVYFAGSEREQRSSEVAIRSRLMEDVYLIFVEPDGEHAVMRMMIHPLVSFVWNGSLLAIIGAILAIAPWKLPFAWAQSGSGSGADSDKITAQVVGKSAVATATAAMLSLALFATPAKSVPKSVPGVENSRFSESAKLLLPEQIYSEAIGNRDPVSAAFVCNCGCGMILQICDHAHCSGRGELLSAIAAMRSEGMNDANVIEAMAEERGLTILSAPPITGFHLAAWFVPGIAMILAMIILWISLVRRRFVPLDPCSPSSKDRDLVDAALKGKLS